MPDTATVTITPIEPFGARVALPEYANNNPTKLTDDDFSKLKQAVLTHCVVVIPDQAQLSPADQYQLTKRFDPSIPEPKDHTGGYGHGKEFHHDQSVLRKDGCTVKDQPQVQILGQGEFAADEPGNENGEAISLTHPSHTTFHHSPLSQSEIVNDKLTRFYRWHIDSALYDLSPPLVTTLLGIKVPPQSQKNYIEYDNGDKLELAQGATCFVSGNHAFERLSDEEKRFVLNTTVEYAPHPYIFIGPAKATSDGLTMVSEGKETPLDQLPQWEPEKVKRLPMVWTNPVTGKPHLQVHGCCINRLHTTNEDGSVSTLELKEAREKVHSLMRPAIAPENVLPYAWNQGDLVVFFNQGVWHSVTGEFKGVNQGADEKRLMHQCNIASGHDPVNKSAAAVA